MPRDTRHVPVLLDPVLRALNPRPGQTVVDCTLGLGGHSAALLERISPGGRLIGIDFDPANIALARAKLTAAGFGMILHLAAVHRAVAILTALYFSAALLPWMLLFVVVGHLK